MQDIVLVWERDARGYHLVEDKVNLNAAETDAVCTKNFLQSAFVGLFIKCIRLDQIGHQF